MESVDQKLAAIRAAKQAIKDATTIEDLRAPLLMIAGMLERNAEAEVVESDLILGVRRPSDTHPV